MKNKKGFTLIELLVVISIIGVLSTIILISLSSARSEAKLVRYKTALRQIETALEIYNLDNNSYPDDGLPLTAAYFCGTPENAQASCRNLDNWIPGLVPTYLPTLPSDVGEGWDGWLYRGGIDGYKVLLNDSPNANGWDIFGRAISPNDPFLDTYLPRRLNQQTIVICKEENGGHNWCND